MAKFTGLRGYYNQKLYVGDEVRVLSTMLWSEMLGKILEQDGKFIFKSNSSGIVYDLATVAYRVCSSVKTPFQVIKDMIRFTIVGKIITRTEIINKCLEEGVPFSEHTIDSIRNYFTQAGYLKLVENDGKRVLGQFVVVKKPDIDLVKSQLLKEAYG